MSTNPFASVQRAVARAAATAGAPTSPGAPDVTPDQGTFEGTLAAVGRWDPQLGALVATWPAVAYPRLIEAVVVSCTQSCAVAIHYGKVTPATRYTSYGDGSLADFSPPIPRLLPANAPLLVVWYTSSSTHTGEANAQLRQP